MIRFRFPLLEISQECNELCVWISWTPCAESILALYFLCLFSLFDYIFFFRFFFCWPHCEITQERIYLKSNDHLAVANCVHIQYYISCFCSFYSLSDLLFHVVVVVVTRTPADQICNNEQTKLVSLVWPCARFLIVSTAFIWRSINTLHFQTIASWAPVFLFTLLSFSYF